MGEVLNKYNVFKEAIKLVALLQASLEQMDELKGTKFYKQKVKHLMSQLERELEKPLGQPIERPGSTRPRTTNKDSVQCRACSWYGLGGVGNAAPRD